MIDLSQCRLAPFAHQTVGVEKLVEHPYFFLGDVMGIGKTKQVIDAAQVLYHRKMIDRIVIICPPSVRSVWHDKELGELAKHLWMSTPALITEFRPNLSQWKWGQPSAVPLRVIITNYEFIRTSEERLAFLRAHCNKKTLLVIDESSAIKSHKAKQTKACMKLRKACGWVWLLNGTPISNSPGDMFSQGQMLHKSILECATWFQFRARYAVIGGFMNKQIVGWLHPHDKGCCDKPANNAVHTCVPGQGLDDLQRRFAPYMLRRLKDACPDLPARMPPIALAVPLTEKNWGIYREMRDEMVAYLTDSTASVAMQAISKVMRLAQITSGFIGGVQDLEEDTSLPQQIIGSEKLDFFIEWIKERLEEDPKFKCIAFSMFRLELARAIEEVQKIGRFHVGEIRGGQDSEERTEALRLLDPRTSPDGPVLVGATPGAGSLGLNLTAANYMIRISNNYSLMQRLQGDDRIHRPGQTRIVNYFDIMATGPQGQKTIDHVIIRALRAKESLATWTARNWVSALVEE